MTDSPPPLPPPGQQPTGHEPDLAPPRADQATGGRPTRVPPSSTSWQHARRRAARMGREATYLIAAFPLAVLAFVVAVTTVSGSAALVTAPVFLTVGGIVLRALSGVERSLQARLLGVEVPAPVYASDYPSTGSVAGNVWRRMFDPQTWLEIAWGLVGFVVSLVTFVLTVTFAATALAGLTSPVWFPIVRQVPDYGGLSTLLLGGPSFVLDLAAQLGAGLLGLLMLLVTTRVGAMFQSSLVGALLGSRGTEARYAAIRQAHTAGQQAERDSLRRLERDLHDGPQQGLVRLQMDLARAERLLETDPGKARDILVGAGQTASSTLGELRTLSRGIAPPLLVDRGLHAALLQLAGTHPAEVTIHDRIGTRLPDQVETALYFAASEALANVAKHARARTVEVVLRRSADVAEVVVTDDGVGGASIAKGHGLAGLERRLAGVQGSLQVRSPEGGPTMVVATVPLPGAR